jgi:hypothetical protein
MSILDLQFKGGNMTHEYNDVHKDYAKNLARWNLVEDVVKSRVKGGGCNNREFYLPKPNPHDKSARNNAAFDNYVKRAHFYNFTKPTENTIIGSIFKKEPVIELVGIDYAIDDIDGSGLPAKQQAKNAAREISESGRGGLFVDYTSIEQLDNQADEEALDARPIAIFYKATQILNWEMRVIGGRRRLGSVVLAEWRDSNAEKHDRERVLSLDESGLFQIDVYDYEDGELIDHEIFFGSDSRGQRLNYVPFQFLGALDNDETVDEALLYELADLNVSHFQSSADYEDFRYKLGQIQPFISGVNKTDIEKNMGEGGSLEFGSGVAWVFGEGASAELLQAKPNSVNMESMLHKEAQAVATGAKLLDPKTGNTSATEAEIVSSSEAASQLTIVSNLESAYKRVFEMMLDRVQSGSSEISFSRDFATAKLSSDELRVLAESTIKGALPDLILFDRLRKAGYVPDGITDEDLRSLVSLSPVGLGL